VIRGNPRKREGMAEEQEPTAAYYRHVAKEMRDLATHAQNPDVRREMFEIADRFERMADYVERRYPDRSGTIPPQSERDDM
jgi:hypothetical protein